MYQTVALTVSIVDRAHEDHCPVSCFEHLASHAAVNPAADSGAAMCGHYDAIDNILLRKIQNGLCGITGSDRNFTLYLLRRQALVEGLQVLLRALFCDPIVDR